jgi:hypothetical protein
MDCINLKKRFGDRFKVLYEEGYYAQHGETAWREDPDLMIIPCKWGHLYPDGPETLAASVDGHPRIAVQIQKLKCCRVHQDGDNGELTVLFDVADFDQVAKIMQPHRKRQWTAEQKQQASERLAKYRYTSAVEGHSSEQTDAPAPGTV